MITLARPAPRQARERRSEFLGAISLFRRPRTGVPLIPVLRAHDLKQFLVRNKSANPRDLKHSLHTFISLRQFEFRRGKIQARSARSI
ncbi:MAG: hypothetical protein HZA31_06715 [Opitutae bacterium]|nr:hypothetical protein [Opitutae bacterium]